MLLLFIVKSKVTTLSQPAELVNVQVAVLLLSVYVLPSIQVYESQAVTISVPVLLLFIVSTKVCVLSHPEALVNT